MATPEAELLSLDQAAKYLNLSSNSLRGMIAQGDGPRYIALGLKGGKRRFRKDALDAFLESRCVDGKKTKGKLKHIKTKA